MDSTTATPPAEEAEADIAEEKKSEPESKDVEEEEEDEGEEMKEEDSVEVQAETKEKVDVKKDDVVSNSPAHEDSDFEDNIVVKVPSASDTRTEKYLSRRHASHPKPPGIEQNSPKSKHQVSESEIKYFLGKFI